MVGKSDDALERFAMISRRIDESTGTVVDLHAGSVAVHMTEEQGIMYLLPAHGIGLLAKSLTRHVETVLADDAGLLLVTRDSAAVMPLHQ